MKETTAPFPPEILAAFAALPWIWSVALIPAWISVISAAVSIGVVAVAAGYRRPHASAPEQDREAGLSGILQRWVGIAHQAHSGLDDARSRIHGVMEQTERAISNVTDSFRTIKDKTSTQMGVTSNLLQNNTALAPSLSQYVGMTTETLHRLADDALICADTSARVLSLETDMQASDQMLERYVDDVQALIQRVGVLAAKTHDPTLAHEINALGCDALKAGNILRNHMHALRRNRAQTCKDICDAASRTRDAAEAVKHDRAHILAGLRAKSDEVRGLVERVNDLGEDIKREVYRVIVELQFHDITRQQLERVKGPILTDLGQDLRSIVQESAVASERLALSARGMNGRIPCEVVPLRPAKPAEVEKPAPEKGNEVELF